MLACKDPWPPLQPLRPAWGGGGWSAPMVGVGGTDHPQALPTLHPLSAPTMVYLEYVTSNVLHGRYAKIFMV